MHFNRKCQKTELNEMSRVKSRKLRHFGHVTREPFNGIKNSVITGLVEGSRSRGRPRICWFDTSRHELACRVPDCRMSHETEAVGQLWLIHAAYRRRANTALSYDVIEIDLEKHLNRIDSRKGLTLEATRCLTACRRTHQWLSRLGVIC